jgi:hypothetical protein
VSEERVRLGPSVGATVDLLRVSTVGAAGTNSKVPRQPSALNSRRISSASVKSFSTRSTWLCRDRRLREAVVEVLEDASIQVGEGGTGNIPATLPGVLCKLAATPVQPPNAYPGLASGSGGSGKS